MLEWMSEIRLVPTVFSFLLSTLFFCPDFLSYRFDIFTKLKVVSFKILFLCYFLNQRPLHNVIGNFLTLSLLKKKMN